MEDYETELDNLEAKIMNDTDSESALRRVNEIRGDIRDMRINYEQLYCMSVCPAGAVVNKLGM